MSPSFVRAFAVGLAGVMILVPASSLANPAKTQVKIRGGKVAMRMENGKISVTQFQGDLGGGQVKMTGNVSGSATTPNSADVKFAGVSLDHVAKLIGANEAPAWLLKMAVSGSISANWQGKGLVELSQSAKGNVTIESGPGELCDEQVLQFLAKLLHVSNLTELQYTSATLQAHAGNGTFVVDKLTADGPQFTLSAEGDYSAVSDQLDLRINVAVSPELVSRSSYEKLKNVVEAFGLVNESVETQLVQIPQLQVSGALAKPNVTVVGVKPATETVPALSAGDDRLHKQASQVAFE